MDKLFQNNAINAQGVNKSEEERVKTISLNPQFDSLDCPQTYLVHVKSFSSAGDTPNAESEVLKLLLSQLKPLDFLVLAYPEVKEIRTELTKLTEDDSKAVTLKKTLNDFKVYPKHYLILSVEHLISIAKSNGWGLCKQNGFIFIYNGAYWENCDEDNFQVFLGEAAEKMGVPVYSAKHFQFREQLFKQFQTLAYLSPPLNDVKRVLINLHNGTFEITYEGTRLRPFSQVDFLTYQLPFSFNETAECPLFDQYLNQVLPDKERQDILAEYLGFTFVKHGSSVLKEEKALILYGSGANGKSVFFEIVSALLGSENISSYSLQSLTDEKGYHRAKLANKLVNYASEINGNLEASSFKQLVSGEPVEARVPYGQPFILREYAKLIFNCNELPKDVEHTNAYFRRFLIIPFDVTIPEEKQDRDLHRKIIDNELSGVFNWVLRGLNRLLKQKRFSKCDAAQAAVDQYKLESNSVKLFLLESGYEKSATSTILLKDLYVSYRTFCHEDGMTPFKKHNFHKHLKNEKILVDKTMHGNSVYLAKAPTL